MKTEKVTCLKAAIEAGSKEEYVQQVLAAAGDFVRSIPVKDREELAIALVMAGIFQDAGDLKEVNAVELCEQCGVHVGTKVEKDAEEIGD